MLLKHGLAGLTHKAAAAGGGVTIVGWTDMYTGGSRIADLTNLDAVGSPSLTGDGGTIAEDDLVVACYGYTSNADRTLGIVTSGYTSQDEAFSNPTVNIETGVFTKFMGATPDTTVEFSYAGVSDAVHSGLVLILRGVDTTTPIDVAIPAHSTTLTPAAITPITSGSLIMGFLYMGALAADNPLFTGYGNLTFVGERVGNGGTNDGISAIGTEEWTGGTFTPTAWTNSGTSKATHAHTVAFRAA